MDNLTVTLSRDEYYHLKIMEAELEMLWSAGVDNWQGYSDALNNYYGDNEYSLSELKDNLFCEIYGAEACQEQ